MFGGDIISGFLGKLFNISMEVATMASSYKNETEKIVPLMKKFLGNGGTVSDFFGMVDIRAYNKVKSVFKGGVVCLNYVLINVQREI